MWILLHVSITSLGLMVFLRDNLPKTKDRAYMMKNKVKKHTAFYYLSTEIHLCSLSLSGINIFLKKS